MAMRSQGQHLFSRIPQANIPRSSFNRSHTHKTTFNAGYLIPIYVDEALPGDTISLNLAAFARLATPIVPFMDNLYMDFFFFAVPNRLIWDNWQRFMGEQTDPGDSTDYLLPQVGFGAQGAASLSIHDYFGIPTGVGNIAVNALPYRAYNLIWNEWFRHQDLQPSVDVIKTDGPDLASAYALLKRGKRHDYFTSCLPWPQKGPGVELPLGTTAPVIPDGAAAPTFFGNSVTSPTGPLGTAGGTGATNVQWGAADNQAGTLKWGDPGLVADLSTATSATINSLREAFQLQRLLERDARGGTRYTEILRSHFGVISPDARLQRPEFLGGGTVPINVHPVPQTSGSPQDGAGYTPTPQGNLAAFATAAARGIGFTKSFVEHSVIIGLVMVRADLTYQQGLHRSWTRRTRYDFYWPALSNLGEQDVRNGEIYLQDPAVIDPETQLPINDSVFGYQERWAEYRYAPNRISGAFRSNYPAGSTPAALDSWHLAQNFTVLPTLSPEFIEENPPIDRVIAVTNEPHFLFDSAITIRAARPMPVYSVPGMIDHF